ncbi:permease-like cell division protein FtsX [Actinophytocola sp.]|uniref:permease-like cell division protein FtsX n=1 Tax=Actinophytocola sp. TaxID=1872138 RepID=UPI003899A926
MPVPWAAAGAATGSATGSALGRRPSWLLVAVLLVVAVGAGFGVGAWIWAGQVEKVYPPGYHALTPEQYDKCSRQVVVYFSGTDPDPVMRAAAAQLRDDPRFESVREETRQQAYKRFKEIFADQPDLVDTATPDTLPASVTLMARKGSTGKQVQGALRAKFPDAEVTVQNYCPEPE